MKKYILIFFLPFFISSSLHAKDPLSSWNNGKSKQSIINFVERVTNLNSKDYVKPEERIAVFDNDGTLWSEQPLYFQLIFAMDRVKAEAKNNPEWKIEQPFKAVLENDKESLVKSGKKGLLKLLMASHAGMTTDEFENIVKNWLKTAKHPTTNKPYTSMVYKPMLELLSYLRVNGFKTYIVSGGGIEFMRPWTEEVYGIPPEQVIGSSIKTKFEIVDGLPVIKRLPEIDFIDDKEGKPLAINRFIGRKPIAAFGNSDGDLQMLQWTDEDTGPDLMVLIRHTDKKREWKYDRKSHIGKLDKALDEAMKKGWTVVDMKKDWKVIYHE